MALRVLLADESVTIKKVFQLSLQDYGADVLTVTAGLDVVPVAKKNKPDIIFADVLLQKKSGYDVAAEIKRDPELKDIPVVLIWSGFMELDEARFRASGANGHLEKPFDTQKLRQLVQSLVPKTQTQKLSEYLQFPRLPDFAETPASPVAQAPSAQTPPPAPPAVTSSTWSMESFEPLQVPEDEADEFVTVDLPPAPPVRAAAPVNPEPEVDLDDDGDNQWIQKTLSNYKVKITPEDEKDPAEKRIERDPSENLFHNEVSGVRTLPPAADLEDDAIELDLSDTGHQKPPVQAPTPPPPVGASAIPALNEKQIEAIIRAQSKEVIEKVVWQVLPEIASQVIEREIQKLLKERDELGPR